MVWILSCWKSTCSIHPQGQQNLPSRSTIFIASTHYRLTTTPCLLIINDFQKKHLCLELVHLWAIKSSALLSLFPILYPWELHRSVRLQSLQVFCSPNQKKVVNGDSSASDRKNPKWNEHYHSQWELTKLFHDGTIELEVTYSTDTTRQQLDEWLTSPKHLIMCSLPTTFWLFLCEQNLKKIHQYRSDCASIHNLKDVVLCVLFDCFYCMAEQCWWRIWPRIRIMFVIISQWLLISNMLAQEGQQYCKKYYLGSIFSTSQLIRNFSNTANTFIE